MQGRMWPELGDGADSRSWIKAGKRGKEEDGISRRGKRG